MGIPLRKEPPIDPLEDLTDSSEDPIESFEEQVAADPRLQEILSARVVAVHVSLRAVFRYEKNREWRDGFRYCFYASTAFEQPQEQYFRGSDVVISDEGDEWGSDAIISAQGNELQYFHVDRELIFRKSMSARRGFFNGYSRLQECRPFPPGARHIAIVTGPDFAELMRVADFSIFMPTDPPEDLEERGIRAPDGMSPDIIFSALSRLRKGHLENDRGVDDADGLYGSMSSSSSDE